MNLPISDLNRRIELLNNVISGRPYDQLELVIYGIDIDCKEIEYWKEIARTYKTRKTINNNKHLPTVTFNTKG